MAKNNAANQDFTNNADGWDLSGGTTPRKLTLSGGDVSISGSGSAVFSFPASTSTLATLALTETFTNKDISNANNTYRAASTTVTGAVELATDAETTTGTDTARAVTPDGLAGSDYGKRVVGIQVSDPGGDAITTGDGKAVVRVPAIINGYNLVAVAGSVSTVSSSGIPTVQLRRSRRTNATTRSDADMLTTKLTIDASEFDSVDAAAAAAINTSNDDVNTGDHIYIDIDVAGTGTKGLYVEMTFQLP